MQKFQSHHSPETALLGVCNDLLLTFDSEASVVFTLLDLMTTFDTVAHGVSLSRLEQSVGVKGMTNILSPMCLVGVFLSKLENFFFPHRGSP